MTNLTSEATKGKNHPDSVNPHLFSSDAWLAHVAGTKIAGMSDIRTCKKSRGYSIKIVTHGGANVLVTFKGDRLDEVTVDRT